MQTATNTELTVVATLAGKVIDLRVQEMEAERELGRGLYQMHEAGVSVDALSAASGLPVERVRSAIESAGRDLLELV